MRKYPGVDQPKIFFKFECTDKLVGTTNSPVTTVANDRTLQDQIYCITSDDMDLVGSRNFFWLSC